MIKMIVGLGNPGQQYEKTRHNAGFLVLDVLSRQYDGRWRLDSALNAATSEVFIAARKLLLQKPLTYMNRSGDAVVKMAHYYKVKPEEILVIHDELDFDAGVMRLKKGGGHAGHNGLRDIIQKLGSRDFYRLRMGIGRPPAGWKVSDYVLSTLSPKDLEEMEGLAEDFVGFLPDLVSSEVDRVMEKINQNKS
jgi:PTH1 family peptidyl-tRNA hydrolase